MAIVYTSQLGLHQHLSSYIVAQCQDKIVCRGLWHCVSIFKNAKLGKAFNFCGDIREITRSHALID